MHINVRKLYLTIKTNRSIPYLNHPIAEHDYPLSRDYRCCKGGEGP